MSDVEKGNGRRIGEEIAFAEEKVEVRFNEKDASDSDDSTDQGKMTKGDSGLRLMNSEGSLVEKAKDTLKKKFRRASTSSIKLATREIKNSTEIIKREALGSDDEASVDIEGESEAERHLRKINASVQADKVKLVRNLVPPTALAFDQRVHAIVETDHKDRASFVDNGGDPASLVAIIEESDAPYLAERVLVNILERVREDRQKIANYQRLVWFLCYMFLFIVAIAIQQSVFTPDLITSYGAMRDEIFGLSGAAVADDELEDIRETVSGWNAVLDFVRDNVISTIFTEEACGDNVCQRQDEWPAWNPAPDATALGGCAVDCGRMITTDVTITFYDAWKLRESVRMVNAILEQDEFCWQGECYPLETWLPQQPRAGWNLCSATEKATGVNTTVCVFDGDFSIDGLPFRETELDSTSAFFGSPKTVKLFAGSWELRYGVSGFEWTHPRTGESTAIAFPAFRGSICKIDAQNGDTENLICQNFAACPDATMCTCEFIDNVYVCHDDLNAPYKIPFEAASVGLDADSYDSIKFDEYAGMEAVADWWRVKTFYGDRSFASLVNRPPNTGRPAPILDATIRTADFPVLNTEDDAVETIDASTDVGFSEGWVNADSSILSIGSRQIVSNNDVTVARTITAFRFADVNIPNGATILKAIIYLTPSNDQPSNLGNTIKLSIRTEDTADAAPFATGIDDSQLNDISRRTFSNAITTSYVPGLSEENDSTTIPSPELRELLQNTISRSDWISGGAVVFTIEGLEGTVGSAQVRAFQDNDVSPVTWLHVEYIETQSFEYIILDGKNDVTEETGFAGSVFGFGALDLGQNTGDSIGLRFPEVNLVRNQKVLRAELSVFGARNTVGTDEVVVENFTTATATSADGPSVNILIDVAFENYEFGTNNLGPYEDNCDQFSPCNQTSVEARFNIGSYDVAKRNFTNTRLIEAMPPFNGEGLYTFADISLAVQEIVDSDSWSPNDAILLRLTRHNNDTFVSSGHKFKPTIVERGVDPSEATDSAGARIYFIVERTLSTGINVSPFPTRFPTSIPTHLPSMSPLAIPTSFPTGCNDRLHGDFFSKFVVNPSDTLFNLGDISSPSVEDHFLDGNLPIDGLCVATLAISKDACRTEFCPTCKFRGLCDRTCGFCVSDIPTSLPTSFPTASPSPAPTTGSPTTGSPTTALPTTALPTTTGSPSIALITPIFGSRRSLEDISEACTIAEIETTSSQTVQVHLYDSESGSDLLNTAYSASTDVEVCLEIGVCYELEISQAILPKGLRFQLGPNIRTNSPTGPIYIRATIDGDIYEYDSCEKEASIVDRIIEFPAALETGSTGPQLPVDTSNRLRCFKSIIGVEARLPTTHFTSCTEEDPALYPYADFEECDEGETHCFYIEVSGSNRKLDADLCYTYHRLGGCWKTLEDLWEYTNGTETPGRGSLSVEACEALQAVMFGTDVNLIDCVACEGDLCDRQDPDWYDNAFGIPAFTLRESAAPILSTEDLLDLNNPAVVCDSVATTDTTCDELYNHLGCNFDNGACTRPSEADESITEPWAPWMMTPNETWRYAVVIDDQVFATVPLALFRVSIDALALETAIASGLLGTGGNAAENEDLLNSSTSATEDGDDITIGSFASAATPVSELEGTDTVLLNLPSLACPECSASNGDTTFRRFTFDVNVTLNNADGYYDWSPKGEPDLDCAWIKSDCIPARGEEYCCSFISDNNLLASEACSECGAKLPEEVVYFTSFKGDEPRARYLANPNLVLYGPLLQQTSRRKSDGCYKNRPFNSKLKYLDDQIGDGTDTDPGLCNAGETEEAYGVDVTFLEGSSIYDEANNDILLDLYSTDDLVGGVPRGFTYAMGRRSTGSHYPIYWDVNLNRSQALKIVSLLEEGNYFDDFTNEATISIITTNRKAKSRLISFLEIQAEVQQTGGIQFEYQVQTIDTRIPIYNLFLWHKNSLKNKIQIIIEFLFICSLLSLIFNELSELFGSMRKLHIGPGIVEYFSSISNWVDLSSYTLSSVMIVQRFMFIREYHRVIDNLEVHYDVYADGSEFRLGRILEYNENMENLQDAFEKIQSLSFFQIIYKVLITCAIMLMVLMLLKAFHFHPHMGIITRTVSKAGYSLTFWFGLQFFISLLYALLAVILFSQSSEGFGSADVTGLLESQFGFSLLAASGMYDPGELRDIPGFNLFVTGLSFYVTQAFFWSYLFISFFIMFNALLAIIVGAYDEVSDEMRRAQKDPLPFFFQRALGIADVPGGALSLPEISYCLEAWVGDKLDLKVHKKDDLEDIIAKLRAPPRNPLADAQTVFKSKVLRLPKTSKFYSFRASPQDPIIAMETNFLALIARTYSEYYLTFVHPDKLVRTNIFGKTKTYKPLDLKGGICFAANILARYGTSADLDSNGEVSKDEAVSIRKLVSLLPIIVDEGLTTQYRLAVSFRHFFNIFTVSMTPRSKNETADGTNAEAVLGTYAAAPAGARRRRRRSTLRRGRRRAQVREDNDTEDENINEVLVTGTRPSCCSDYLADDNNSSFDGETQSLAHALAVQRAMLLKAHSEGRLGD